MKITATTYLFASPVDGHQHISSIIANAIDTVIVRYDIYCSADDGIERLKQSLPVLQSGMKLTNAYGTRTDTYYA